MLEDTETSPSAITPHDRGLLAGKTQAISCTISGLGTAADIKWIDPDNNDIPAEDSTSYIVADGKTRFVVGNNQVTTLTIKTDIMAALTSAKTYTCQVTVAGSPPSQGTVTITPIGM